MTSQNGSIDGRELVSTVNGTVHPDPEVPERLERARRRQFTVGYKPRILSEADAARTTGEIGALPRREGLYSSHLAAWRRQREEGILNALSPRRRGRPTSWPEQRELARLRQENERLSQRLVAAEAVIEVPKKGCVVARAGRAEPSERRAALMASVTELVPIVGVEAACEAVGVARAGFYREARRRRAVSAPLPPPSPRHEGAAGELSVPGAAAVADRAHPRALSPAEQQAVRDVLHSERFRDAAPAAVYATLPDEGTYLASERTMYRLLAAEGETRSRRDQLAHPTYTKPELLATAPNRVWSWDITKPLGPAKWTYFYLYVILDIYSRYVVGWMVAHREHADLAERLIAATVAKQGVPAGQLTLHADRGSSMTSKPVAFLLADLGVAKTHSRPHVSNDTPYSEAQSKTLKYRPGFPDRFASIEEARAFCQDFFRWYNAAHRHSGIGLLTPEVVHYGQAQAAYDSRAQVLATAYAAHPERFVRQAPSPPQLPTAARINPPTPVSDPLNPSEEVRQSFPAPRVSNLLTGSDSPRRTVPCGCRADSLGRAATVPMAHSLERRSHIAYTPAGDDLIGTATGSGTTPRASPPRSS